MSYRKQWQMMLSEVCADAVPQRRLREILNTLLEGPHRGSRDLRRSEFIHFADELTKPSPAPTPVERLLMFVSAAHGRIQAEIIEEKERSVIEEDGPSTYWTENHPEYLRRQKNLKRLVRLSLITARQRAFSKIDLIRLLAQWSSFSHSCAGLYTAKRLRQAAFAASAKHLTELENALRELPPEDVEVQSIRSMCLYRRIIDAVKAGFGKEANWAVPGNLLTELLSLPTAAVPPGLYFHGAKQVYRIPLSVRRDILRASRLKLGAAFATLPVFRCLDRIGICYLLGQDAILCNGVDVAEEMLLTADALVESEPRLAEQRRTIIAINRMRYRLMQQVEEVEAPDPVQSEVIASLMDNIRPLLKENYFAAYEQLLRCKENETEISRLYNDVATLWLGRSFANNPSSVLSQAFLEVVEKALEQYRHEPKVGILVGIGCTCRAMKVRSDENIDLAFAELERVLAVYALYGEWQMLIDQLTLEGHHLFLDKLGFDSLSEKLIEVAGYLQRVLNVEATDAVVRNSAVNINQLLFGEALMGSDLRSKLDPIEGRWRGASKLEIDGELTTVRRWADSYKSSMRYPEFRADSSDPIVRNFFADCEQILKTEVALKDAPELDPIPIFASMAFAAYHICRILRSVKQGDSSKVLMTHGLSDADWVKSGIEWADRGRELARRHSRTSSLYRCLDARQRLEQLRDRHSKLIADFTTQMLRIDEDRARSTALICRRNRAIIRTERSLSSVMKPWALSFRSCVGLNSDQVLAKRFALTQQLKAFNYGQLNRAVPEDADEDSSTQSIADNVINWSTTPDIFDREDLLVDVALEGPAKRRLLEHLRTHDAVILDFITNPSWNAADWQQAIAAGWGTVCFVVKAGANDLVVRPIYLDVPEDLLRQVIDGASEQEANNHAGGLRNDLVTWPSKFEGDFGSALKELSDRLFPGKLLYELRGFRKVYLCPHRQLFQIPIHAFPLPLEGRCPLSVGFDVSYALKTAHIVDLLGRTSSIHRMPTKRWSAVDTDEMHGKASILANWTDGSNQWGRERLGIEGFLREAAMADQAIVCCHGQLDEARPGRTRLNLWGGGRLLADDIHRIAGGIGSGQKLDLSGSDWVIAACDAGRPSRVAISTAPGLALSLVVCGAGHVTTCLYRVTPEIAAQWISKFLSACDNPIPQQSPFATAARRSYGRGSRDGWATMASFVSYGLFAEPQAVLPRQDSA
jgi:hypothetical protein